VDESLPADKDKIISKQYNCTIENRDNN